MPKMLSVHRQNLVAIWSELLPTDRLEYKGTKLIQGRFMQTKPTCEGSTAQSFLWKQELV